MARKANSLIQLNQSTRSVETKGPITIDNEVVFAYFDGLRAADYDAAFQQALVLGCYAMSQESIAQMLDATARDLDGRLEQMKLLFQLRDMKQRSAAKGAEAEEDIADVLQAYADARRWDDTVTATGNSVGSIARRKVGDFVIDIAGSNRSIVVEAKWDTTVGPGDPGEAILKGATGAKVEKTAYGQNVTALANRNADIAIFVGDVANSSAGLQKQGRLVFLPEQPGFQVLVDRANGDWSLLQATYALCRTLVLMEARDQDAYRAIDFVVKRLQADLQRLADLEAMLESVSASAQHILDTAGAYAQRRAEIQSSLATTADFLDGWTEAPPDALAMRNVLLGVEVD